MTQPSNQLATQPAMAIQTLDDMDRVAKSIAGSGMFGITRPDQAIALMLLCQAEGLNPIAALRRFHLIEGKPSMRADAMQGEFQTRGGGILWHRRTDAEVAASFFEDAKKMDKQAVERCKVRYEAMSSNDLKTADEQAWPGEVTVIRTMADADAKKTSMSWNKEKGEWKRKHVWQANPRQMLTARCVTEGIRLTNPALIAGIYSEDEVTDIVDAQRDEYAQIASDPNATDREAMEAILRQHEDDAAVANTDAERKRLQGLAAEMRCRIADLDAKPTNTVDTQKLAKVVGNEYVPGEVIVQHAENEEPEDELPGIQKPAPAPKRPAAEETTDWRTVDFSHKNPSVGSLLHGRTVGDIYASDPKVIARARKILGGFMQTMDEIAKKTEAGETVAFAPQDMRLYQAICEAERWLANQAK